MKTMQGSSAGPVAASSQAVRTMMGAGVAQFTGNYLTRSWTRRFILGSLLQKYNPLAVSSSSSSPASEMQVDVAVLSAQRRLCDRWQLPAKPIDSVSESRILRLLARAACGEGLLSAEALSELEGVLALLPRAPLPLQDPQNLEELLRMMGYVRPGDNLRRVAYAGTLHYPPQAESFMEPYLCESLQKDGGDVFDSIRRHHGGPAYAIDSETTSEVDDAIGVETDPKTGEKSFVVYVSDATVYCPFDSQLEQLTARALVTTTYLPEGVFFMLPKPIVEAATLREDRPCRTFCIQFQVDESSGELKQYSVHIGWLHQLRRITYDQVQGLLSATKPTASAGEEERQKRGARPLPPPPPPPSWVTEADRSVLQDLYRVAQIRFNSRIRRALAHNKSAISGSLPEPLIKVKDRRVISLTDQVVSTQDARLAVAEFMIAANEVCSRVAQAERLPIPFRGTRPLSSDHEAAKRFVEPLGVEVVASLDASHTFLAERMHQSVKELSGVTRAMYSHLPTYHAGLDTTYYTHSTSPLRRYADMLVHHQLKVWLWRKHHGGGGGGGRGGGGALGTRQLYRRGGGGRRSVVGLPIPEYVMATLCANISMRQERAALLQDGSTRFWTLTYVQQQILEGGGEKRCMCLVGETKDVTAAPEYPRYGPAIPFGSTRAPTDTHQQGGKQPSRRFVSEIYIPELQLAHRVFHSHPGVVVGAVVECRVVKVQPTQDVLQLQVVRVHPGGDERLLEKLWLSGVVSHLDS